MRFMTSSLLVSAVSLSFFVGCGKYDVAPVSGKITLDGQPLEGATVSFTPIATPGQAEAGPASYAQTDAEGKYELKLLEDDSLGAQVGKHQVYLSAQTADGDAGAVPDLVPPHEREREFEVPDDGTESANFKLTSEPPAN